MKLSVQIYFIFIIAVLFNKNTFSQTKEVKYQLICKKDKTTSDGKGATVEPLEIISINTEGQTQVVQYTFDGRHELFNYFKRRAIKRDSFSIQMDQYLIDTLNLGKWENSNKLLILLKMGADNRCMIIPDVNFSGKFSDDPVYYSTNPEKDEVVFNCKLNFWYKTKHSKEIDFVLMPNPKFLPKANPRAVFNAWGGARKVMTGMLKIGLDSFICKTYLIHHSIYYSFYNARFSFSKANENYVNLYEDGYPIFKYGDSIYVGNKILMLDKISILGDTVIFKEVGINSDMNNVREGAILKNFWGKDFSTGETKIINLQDSSKEFTLIHFWGSWCSPCIENFPKLKKLHEAFAKNVSFVGIPFEALKDTVKAKNLIEKYKMVWEHFIQMRDDPFNKADIIRELRIDAFPTYFLINSKGKIVIRTSEISEVEKKLSIIK